MNLDFLNTHFAWLGPWFFFLGAMVEALPFIGTFLPGATIVTLGGFAAAQGYYSLGSVIAFSIIGAIIGDAISFYIGIHGGDLARRKQLINSGLLQKGEDFFLKYGNQSLFWGRFIGPIRSVMPFLAGLAKLKQSTFWLWNIVSGIAWGFFYVLLGYSSGNLVSVILSRWNHKLAWLISLSVITLSLMWLNKHHGESIKQYFKNESARLAHTIEGMKLIERLEKRYPAFSELFVYKSAQLKLYFAFFGFIILIILTALTFIFDWI